MNEDKQGNSVSNVYNRRRFMQLASLAAGGTLLAACGGNEAAQPLKPIVATTLPQNQIEATVTASVGKTYFPGGPHVPDAYTAPPPAFQTVKYVPGTGKRVQAFEIFYATPSMPKSQNKFWQELDKKLNVDWEVIQVVSDDYDTKTAVMLNSGSPPDLFFILNNTDSVFATALQQGAFNDLTSFLSGNGLKEFPNLARIAPSIWQNSRFQGKIFGVPRSRPELGDVMMYRKDWADRLGLGMPQNPNEYMQMLKAFTNGDPTGTGRKVWGFGGRAFFGTNHYITNMFGVPNNWQVESDGSFTNAIETDEYKQALAFERSLWAAGVYYPDSPVLNNKQAKTDFEAGKYGAYLDGIGAVPDEQKRAQVVDPHALVHILVPTNNQGKYTRYLAAGYAGTTGIPSRATSDPDRIKELLRVLDYLSAPPFSLESNFLTYGIDGWDSVINSHGVRQLTSKGQDEIGELTVLANGPQVYYLPENPPYAVYLQEATRQMVTGAIPDPSWGLDSPTLDQQGTALQTLLNNGFQRIVRGQDPLSALSTLIQQWKAQGGAKVKQELAEAYHKVHG
jgi:putative aldouronate transport system substrate-binding protein